EEEADELEDDDEEELPLVAPLPPLPPFRPLPPPFAPLDPVPLEPFDADELPDPVADPVAGVPPVPLLASCSPGVTLTCDSTPSNVAPAKRGTGEAQPTAVCALVSGLLAAAALDSPTPSRSAETPDDRSSSSCAWARAAADCAEATFAWSWAESIVAST